MHQQYQLDHSLDAYIQKMTSYGVQVNTKLQPALFYLKNGLKYSGLLTSETIHGHQQLVSIPISLLLTAHKAMKDPELEEVFADKFYKEGTTWQDRILVTYILYLLSTNKQCIWTHMARQFSKDIDIISFWQQEQFADFVDRSVAKAAMKERKHFQEEWRRFQSIQEDYKLLQDKNWFTRENYKWIYIHTISRCFGSFLKSTYFVPFCELFNHNSVDVSYTCIDQNKQSSSSQNIANAQSQPHQEAQENDSDSISSGYSQDYLSDDDFDYMSITSYSIKWGHKISYDLKDKELKAIEQLLLNIYQWIDKQLELKGFTLIYLGQIIEKLKIFENEYKAGRQKYQATIQRLTETKLSLNAYRKYLVQLYRSQGREYQKVKNQRGVQAVHTKNTSWSHFDKTREQCKQTYTHFKMQARDDAHFDKNTQIYFSYGKLSNRTLLVRYGFSLQNNPYEHVWIKFKLGQHIEPYPDLFELIQTKGLPVNYKVKLKSYTFALQPIVYFRVLRWKTTHHTLEDIFFITDIEKELEILSEVQEVYEGYLKRYEHVDDSLEDKGLGYHGYFRKVYNIEQKAIILKQLTLLKYVIKTLNKVRQKELDVKTLVGKSEYKQELKHYFKGLRGVLKV